MLTIGTADATLPESRRVFAVVDHAEGIGAPDGSDPRCPQRTGIMPDDVGPRPDGGSWEEEPPWRFLSAAHSSCAAARGEQPEGSEAPSIDEAVVEGATASFVSSVRGRRLGH